MVSPLKQQPQQQQQQQSQRQRQRQRRQRQRQQRQRQRQRRLHEEQGTDDPEGFQAGNTTQTLTVTLVDSS